MVLLRTNNGFTIITKAIFVGNVVTSLFYIPQTATLFNWVDVSVACTSTPRLSVNQATACCCAVLIIAHSTVYVLHAGISLDTVYFVQALQ